VCAFSEMGNSVNVTYRGIIELLFNLLRLSRIARMDFDGKKSKIELGHSYIRVLKSRGF
jgi:hypothetical protein